MIDNNQLSNSSAGINLPASSLTSQDKIVKAINGFGPEYGELVFCKYQKPMGIEKAVSANAPTFHNVTEFFGEEATRFWLRFHIAETFAFLGIYDTASKYQVQQTAELILSHEIFGQLTLSEFLCFLQRFKLGRYGKIYQSQRPNPQEFLMCLTPFWNELCQERGREEERKRQAQLHEERRNYQPPTPEEQAHIREIQEKLANKFNANPPKKDENSSPE